MGCPTYKKQKLKPNKRQAEADNEEINQQFSCSENNEVMHYKASHPPSWTDRIFHNADSTDWLGCSQLHRITRDSDHDAVFLTCSVQPGAGCEEENEEAKEEVI